MPGIFLSYRREDAPLPAHLLFDELLRRFGAREVFMDVGLTPGVDFVEELDRALADCRVLLAVIGKGWADAHDKEGRRRLQDPDDFVRMEIGTALARTDVT